MVRPGQPVQKKSQKIEWKRQKQVKQKVKNVGHKQSTKIRIGKTSNTYIYIYIRSKQIAKSRHWAS